MVQRLKNPDQRVELPLADLLLKLWRQKFVMLIFLGLGVLTSIYSYQRQPSYVSKTTLLIQKAQNSSLQEISAGLSGLSGGGLAAINKDLYIEKYLLYLASRDFFSLSAERLANSPNYRQLLKSVDIEEEASLPLKKLFFIDDPVHSSSIEDLKEELTAHLADHTTISRNGVSGLDISVTSFGPDESVELATTLINTAIDMIVQRELKELDEAKLYLEAKLAESETKLNEINQGQTILRKRNSLSIATLKGDTASQIESILKDLEETKIKLEQNRALSDLVSSEVKTQTAQGLKGSFRPAIGGSLPEILTRQIETLSQRRIELLAAGVDEKSHKIKLLDQEIVKTQQNLLHQNRDKTHNAVQNLDFLYDGKPLADKLNALHAENLLLTTKISATSKILNKLTQKKQSLPQDEQSYFDLGKRSELQYLMFAELSKQIFQLDIQRISVQNKIGKIETPSSRKLERRPSFISCFILSMFFSILIGAALITYIDYRNPVIIHAQDVSSAGLEVFGTVPQLRALSQHNTKKLANNYPIIKHHIDSPGSLIFKHLRSRILLNIPPQKTARLITVHSSISGEGKSFIAKNLAESIVASGQKVLLIDSDIRGHGISDIFAHDEQRGISSVLTDEYSLEEVILKNINGNLDVVPAGPFYENSTELMLSQKYFDVINAARQIYHYIVIDTPPIVPVPDALGIAGMTDLPLLVVMSGKTSLSDLNLATARLTQATDKELMVVLNCSGNITSYYYARRPLPTYKSAVVTSRTDNQSNANENAA